MPGLTPLVLNDCRIYYASADLTSWSNKVSFEASVADEDSTTFASGGAKERVGGLFDTSASVDFFWEAGDLSKPDDTFWVNLGTTDPLTVVPTSGAVGSVAYLTQVLGCEYKPGANTGKLLAGTAALKGNWPPVRGVVMHPQGTARTVTSTGTSQQLGALLATQALYVTLHVFSIAGTGAPTITVRVESDDNVGFTSPVTQATFSAATVLGGQSLRIVGPVTDNFWRVAWTISGTTPSFLFASAAGIGRK